MYLDSKILETSIAVGPSAAPITPIAAASLKFGKISDATSAVRKIPNWAAAPNSSIFGFESSGPKSIIAPIPINKSSGIASDASIPTLNSQSTIPCEPSSANPTAPDHGILTKIAPNPIGISSAGSKSFTSARYIKTPPMANITRFFQPSAENRKAIPL